MSVLIDTSVWSLALRRHRRELNPEERAMVFDCRNLIITGEAALIGPVLQEALSGISVANDFEQLRNQLLSIEELPVTTGTFILAAEFFNTLRTKGISPEAIDMTICAAAYLHTLPIFTTDPDFPRYAKHIPIALYRR